MELLNFFWRRSGVKLAIFCSGLICGSVMASMPMPDPLPFADYLKRHSPIIFMGNFKRMVYISSTLGEKLIGGGVEIAPGELAFSEKNSRSVGGESFAEISDLKLIYIPSAGGNIKCSYPIAYFRLSIIQDASSERDLYYKNLIGKDVVLFWDGPAKYGRSLSNFPAPYFVIVEGGNWRDARPLGVERMIELHKLAPALGYTVPSKNYCNK